MEKSKNKLIFDKLKLEIKQKAKNGIDFIFAASIIWLLISLIWKFTTNTSYDKAIFTFIIGSLLLPLALLLSKLFKTTWKIKENPLQPLGLWLNFAQLIYFPFLIFILLKFPDYFIMAYAIITGAHLFPYAWYYNETPYAIIAILISVGALFIALFIDVSNIYYIPFLTCLLLVILGVWLTISSKKLNANKIE
ncbi:hypothetical protein SAMN05444411_110140 [Lutibacter oricola]|uniref:Uncharacterized protein n=1 Tax=Lutibacter oricola TaxID=762486 RepID=A0A1H3F6J1_9FLAO|nr:hypothetical protein [Lutibacter oricola]SDX86525.1 hypothetical protein SAMN05444411_110140 [Lutibacter oricola]